VVFVRVDPLSWATDKQSSFGGLADGLLVTVPCALNAATKEPSLRTTIRMCVRVRLAPLGAAPPYAILVVAQLAYLGVYLPQGSPKERFEASAPVFGEKPCLRPRLL
jgi:hypothetical protein